MEDSLAQKIIQDMAKTYDSIAKPFSVSRQKPWSEFRILMDMIHTMSLMNQTNPEIRDIKILDIGCGNGRVAEIAQQCKVEYTGIDVSEKLIQLAREKYPAAHFEIGSMLKLPFPDQSYDMVIAIASLQHIPSDKLRRQALLEMYRVAKQNDLLFMTNWNLFQSKWEKYFIQDNTYDNGDALIPWKDSSGNILAQRYYHGFKIPELEQLLLKTGWEMQAQYYSNQQYNIVTIAKKS